MFHTPLSHDTFLFLTEITVQKSRDDLSPSTKKKKKDIYLKNPLNQLYIAGNCLSWNPKSGIECTWDLK